jgi:hypothetical protein
MSLEFDCRWSSTVANKEICQNYFKYWGSIVGGVLLTLEFCGDNVDFICGFCLSGFFFFVPGLLDQIVFFCFLVRTLK